MFDKILASEPVDNLARKGLSDSDDKFRGYLRPKLFQELVIKQWLELERKEGRWGNKMKKENIVHLKDEIAVALGYKDFQDYLEVIESRGLRWGKLNKKEIQKRKQINRIDINSRIFNKLD